MSDDYNKKVASSELAKLGIVETKKEDTPKINVKFVRGKAM